MSSPLPIPFSAPDLRFRTRILLFLGTGQLLLFLGTAARNFYWGSRAIVLKVHIGLALTTTYPPLSRVLPTSAGTYFTGTQGELLYQPTSFGHYLLFYSIGDLTLVQVLFLFSLSLYLHQAMRKLLPGHELSQGLSRAFSLIGLATLLMYTIETAFSVHLNQLFQAQTHHQFSLATRNTSVLYVFFGSMLLLCIPFLQLGSQLQQENELTI